MRRGLTFLAEFTLFWGAMIAVGFALLVFAPAAFP